MLTRMYCDLSTSFTCRTVYFLRQLILWNLCRRAFCWSICWIFYLPGRPGWTISYSNAFSPVNWIHAVASWVNNVTCVKKIILYGFHLTGLLGNWFHWSTYCSYTNLWSFTISIVSGALVAPCGCVLPSSLTCLCVWCSCRLCKECQASWFRTHSVHSILLFVMIWSSVSLPCNFRKRAITW